MKPVPGFRVTVRRHSAVFVRMTRRNVRKPAESVVFTRAVTENGRPTRPQSAGMFRVTRKKSTAAAAKMVRNVAMAQLPDIRFARRELMRIRALYNALLRTMEDPFVPMANVKPSAIRDFARVARVASAPSQISIIAAAAITHAPMLIPILPPKSANQGFAFPSRAKMDGYR